MTLPAIVQERLSQALSQLQFGKVVLSITQGQVSGITVHEARRILPTGSSDILDEGE